MGADDAGFGVTLGGGVTLGEADGLAGDGDAGAIGLALHAANASAATSEAANARRDLDITDSKVLAVEAASAVPRRRANLPGCVQTNVHKAAVETYATAPLRVRSQPAARNAQGSSGERAPRP